MAPIKTMVVAADGTGAGTARMNYFTRLRGPRYVPRRSPAGFEEHVLRIGFSPVMQRTRTLFIISLTENGN